MEKITLQLLSDQHFRHQDRLALCEKALAEYLETKRLAFPRFYFVSSADLLDILSKGNQPLLVARHLSKLFDNLHRLEFKMVRTLFYDFMLFGEINDYCKQD